MRVRELLLVHPNRATRALIKKYILTELCDIDIHEAEDAVGVMGMRGASWLKWPRKGRDS